MRLSRTLTLLLVPALVLLPAACRDAADPSTVTNPDAAQLGTAVAAATLSFRQISTGANHTCGVTTDDRAYCWGANGGGQLGIGGPVDNPDGDYSTRPIAVTGGLRFLSVSAGADFTCGLTTDNLAYCWGVNYTAQLGDGSRTLRKSPTAVAGGRHFRQLRSGRQHTCAVTLADVAFCWGDNSAGQLGDGTTHGPLKPVKVAGGLLLRRVLAGVSHTCGSTATGKTYCWGNNTYGQLGRNNTTPSLTPVAVNGALLFTQLSTGRFHSCGVASGKAYCWGRGRYGQLGTGGTSNRLTPAAVAGGLQFRGVSAGSEYTCGVTTGSAAAAYCWGNGVFGRLGNGGTSNALTPSLVSGGLQWASVNTSVTSFTTCGVTTGAKGYCWGDNFTGELGDGSTGGESLTPSPVAAPS